MALQKPTQQAADLAAGMIPKGAFLKVVDNSGAKLAQVTAFPGKLRFSTSCGQRFSR
jgi:hypothetical protein